MWLGSPLVSSVRFYSSFLQTTIVTIDKALLKEHMTLVYNALRQEEAGILS
jgi:hypothetical protein